MSWRTSYKGAGEDQFIDKELGSVVKDLENVQFCFETKHGPLVNYFREKGVKIEAKSEGLRHRIMRPNLVHFLKE